MSINNKAQRKYGTFHDADKGISEVIEKMRKAGYDASAGAGAEARYRTGGKAALLVVGFGWDEVRSF